MDTKKILNKYKACLIGLALGDVLGAPFEFWSREEVQEYFEHNNFKFDVEEFRIKGKTFPVGFYTDDTAQMMCLAESLLEKGFDTNDQFLKYKKWYKKGDCSATGEFYDIGDQTEKILKQDKILNVKKLKGDDEMAGGNGSLMRCAPIALYYQGNYEEIKDKSILASYVTHNYYITAWTNVILNSIISLIIEGVERDSILKKVLNLYSDIPGELVEVLSIDYKMTDKFNYNISGYSLDTLRVAIWSWMKSESFEESIYKVILLGKDTDTFGAVTGALSGTYFGYKYISNEWINKIINKEKIIKLAIGLLKKNEKNYKKI